MGRNFGLDVRRRSLGCRRRAAKDPGGFAPARSALEWEASEAGISRTLGISRAVPRSGPTRNKQTDLRALDNPFLRCDPQRRANSIGSTPCSRAPSTPFSTACSSKSAIGKRNEAGRITLRVQENVAAGSGPIEIFNEVGYRFDHVRAIVPEYLLDRARAIIFAQQIVIFLGPFGLRFGTNSRSMLS